MSLTTTISAGLAAIATANSELSVAVVYNGESCTGLGQIRRAPGVDEIMGEVPGQTGRVHIVGGAITEPMRGATILIDGAEAKVEDVVVDGGGAHIAIDYRIIRQVSGV